MEVVKEQIDELNVQVKIQLKEEDYQPKVDLSLKDLKKKANMKGFRPGMVPMGLIKKMYGTSVILEEVNKLISESLTNYIKEEDLKIIGEPIPNKDQKTLDFDKQKDFEFVFDLGLHPEFELNLNKRLKIPFYINNPDEKAINAQIESHTGKYGSVKALDEIEESAFIKADLKQLIIDSDELEPIVVEAASLSIDYIKDDDIKKLFIGAKINDEIKFDIKKAFLEESEIAAILGIEKEELKNLYPEFMAMIKEISKFEKAEINQELFDKIYGEGIVNSEEEFKTKIGEEIRLITIKDSNYKFTIDAKEKIVDRIEINLPEEFLKRWLLTKEDYKKVKEEDFDKDFPELLKTLKWQLINNKIIEDNKIEVSEDEIKDLAIELTEIQFQQYYGLPAGAFPKEQLEQYAQDLFLKKEEEVRKLYDRKYQDKVVEIIKEAVKLDEKEISAEEFNKLFLPEDEKKESEKKEKKKTRVSETGEEDEKE